MKILGFSFMTIFWLFIFFYLGTKFPNALKGLPVIGR